MATVDIEQLFRASSSSVRQFLIQDGQGCYIPAYQRPYAWDKDNVRRLVEDAVHSITHLSERPETINFLGTVIAIHDTDYSTIQPLFRTEVPSRVMTIIDGQQRLCTFVLANIVFHDELRIRARQFETKPEEQFKWIYEESIQQLAHLKKTIEIDRDVGEGDYRYYPRVIRAMEDAWSKRSLQAKYESPISRLIWGYIKHSHGNDENQYQYSPTDENGAMPALHQPIADIFHSLRSEISALIDVKHDTNLPSIHDMAVERTFAPALWGYQLPDAVRDFLTNSMDDPAYNRYCEVFRLLVLALYLNDRIAFTIVTTKNEDDAFDMFEALNTTGEPLTAFETFRPKVIESETLSCYEGSPSFVAMQKVESYLDKFEKAPERQSATSRLLVPFALAENGLKLPGRLNSQRGYLRNTFDHLETLEGKRDFVTSLSTIADFVHHAWDIDKRDKPSLPGIELDDEALLCLAVLKDLKHDITIAPIVRFYAECLRASANEREERIVQLNGAIKATTAFSFLWRGTRTTTDGIDSHYRTIVSAGVPNLEIQPLGKRLTGGDFGVVNIANYRRALRHFLDTKGRIESEENFLNLVAQNPVCRKKIVTRFLLMAASDDCVEDEENPGLVVRGRLGIQPMLTLERWRQEEHLTVEHIAPQSSDGSWAPELYEDPASVDRLGNLTLLPASENNVVANRPWIHKRALFNALSSNTEEQFDNSVEGLTKFGLTLSKSAEQTIGQSKYLVLCKAIASRDGDWTLPFVEERSRRIASLAWKRLRPWLDDH